VNAEEGQKTADFDFVLPPDLIAQQPVPRRDASRMMVLHRESGTLEHRAFADFRAFVRPGDVLVLNTTRVIPARLFATKPSTGGRVEVFLLEQTEPDCWQALLKARRRPDPETPLLLEDGRSTVRVVGEGPEGSVIVRFAVEGDFDAFLDRHGHVPLPPYIKRDPHQPSTMNHASRDRERYQTVYAQEAGSVAAPTAGLHFTTDLLDALRAAGVRTAGITLHVGLGTFRPVKTDRVDDHVMHEERYVVGDEAARTIREAHAAGGRVIAIGSTAVRTLETVARDHGDIVAATGRTSIFIRPPHVFRAVDAMLTNFHLPKSTLLMMVSAFAARHRSPQAGREFVLRAYAEAVQERYRFFSYGDCMLID